MVAVVATDKAAWEYLRTKGVHELFEDQANFSPDAIAVVFDTQTLTYQELNRQASRLAHHLQSIGVQPGAIVSLTVERSIEMVVALVGILKAGGVYWGREDHLPEVRWRQRLINARPAAVIGRRKGKEELARVVASASADPEGTFFPCEILAIEEVLDPGTPEPPNAFVPPVCHSEEPAYVTYTSGSTGQPHGVLVPHRGVARLVKQADYVSLSGQETLLHLSQLSFDASTFELWGALLNGGRVVVMPPGQPTPEAIGEAVSRHGVTTMWLSAGLFHVMVDERPEALKPLRQLLAGGDVLSPSHVIKACRALPGCRIINGYGPSENTTFSCCYTVSNERDLIPAVPIGRPIAHTQAHVLDEAMQPVSQGVMGELYVGGDGVACGYLNLPLLTAERFFPDSFSKVPGARMYRTGDCVRLRADGNLEFLGRMDSQVKFRGYRVELGEIETALRAQPEVRDAVVVVREDCPGERRLAAYLIAEDEMKPSLQELGARLAEKLPNYMQPNAYVWLEGVPLTANGKVDRAALPVPPASGVDVLLETGQPMNLLEFELIRIWQGLFRREGIVRQDNFFALGGDSLLATHLVLEIEQRLDCKLPIAALFQAPTVEALSRRLTEEHSAPPWSSVVPLQPLGSRPPLFLVHGVGGDVYSFLGLAQHLLPDQPVYGLQAVGLDGKSPRHPTVEAMAAHYVEEILSAQPEGPCFLGGFSLGGIIAYEVAQQLHRKGRQVALLALLDTEPVGRMPWKVYLGTMASFVPRRIAWHWQRFHHLPAKERRDYLRGRWRAFRYWIQRNLRSSGGGPASVIEEHASSQGVRGEDYFLTAGRAYRLREYPGTVDIIVSEESDQAWVRIWKDMVAGGAAFYQVPGSHLGILEEPYVAEVARKLSSIIASKHNP